MLFILANPMVLSCVQVHLAQKADLEHSVAEPLSVESPGHCVDNIPKHSPLPAPPDHGPPRSRIALCEEYR